MCVVCGSPVCAIVCILLSTTFSIHPKFSLDFVAPMILDQFWIVSVSRSIMYSFYMLNDTMQQCTTTICACC